MACSCCFVANHFLASVRCAVNHIEIESGEKRDGEEGRLSEQTQKDEKAEQLDRFITLVEINAFSNDNNVVYALFYSMTTVGQTIKYYDFSPHNFVIANFGEPHKYSVLNYMNSSFCEANTLRMQCIYKSILHAISAQSPPYSIHSFQLGKLNFMANLTNIFEITMQKMC